MSGCALGLLHGFAPELFPKEATLGVCACFSAGGRKRGGAVRLSVARPAPGFLSAGLLSLRSSPQRLIPGAMGGRRDGAVGARPVCVDVLGAGAGSAGSEVLLAAWGVSTSLSDLPF